MLQVLDGERGVAHAEAEVLDVVERLVEELGDVVVVEVRRQLSGPCGFR